MKLTRASRSCPVSKLNIAKNILIPVINCGGVSCGQESPLVSVLLNFTVEGKENLPEDGPLLIVGNHFHFWIPLPPSMPQDILWNSSMTPSCQWRQTHALHSSLWRTLKIMQGTANLEAMRASRPFWRKMASWQFSLRDMFTSLRWENR